MSLLLDALQRASDEKEGAASPDVAASTPLTFADTPTPPPPPAKEKLVQAAAPATTTAPATASTSPAANISPRIAREILGATAKSGGTDSRSKQVVLLLLAGILVLGSGSFLFGLWDDLLDPPAPKIKPMLLAGAKVARQAQPPAPPSAPSPAAQPVVPGNSPAIQPATPATQVAPSAALPANAPKAADATPLNKTPAGALFTSGPRHEPPANAARPVFVAKPGSAKALDTGYAALTEGRLDDAAASYRLALKNNPEERDALLGLAHIAHRQGRQDEARMLYQRVLHQDPTQATATAGLLALQTDEDIQNTTSRAQEMTERTPESATAFATLGNLLVREGRLADAQQAFFRAMSLEPENCFHAYNLAVALDRLHKYDLALRYYESALTLAEKSPAGVQGSFPKESAQLRREQLRNRAREERLVAH